jgi:hypothetical protein
MSDQIDGTEVYGVRMQSLLREVDAWIATTVPHN